MTRWLLSLVLGAGVAAAGYRQRALTAGGALAAALLGGVVFARGGARAAAALLSFFVSSSAVSRLKTAEKARRGVLAQAKGGRRDARQVLANGGAAGLWIATGPTRGAGGFLGAVSSAAADTWATELGLLARGSPRLITTLRPVQPGTSGGVTPEGVFAAAGGALVVGWAWALTDRRTPAVRLALVAGVLGSLVDSLLGATVQATYWCAACGVVIEEPVHRVCGQAAELRTGSRWVDNDMVNGLATVSGGLIGAALWRYDDHRHG